tara:strand:+ start:204 stop:1358 length:1155 start_codon:yes stop_codon:yes gene_type:complete
MTDINSWYQNYKENEVNITPFLHMMHSVMDTADMAIDDRYIDPSIKFEEFKNYSKQHNLTNEWDNFYKTYVIHFQQLVKKRFVISLSGGVDSMTLLYVIKQWKEQNKIDDCDLIALHINFNNRKCSYLEEMYLKNWCKSIDVKLYVHEIKDYKRSDINREEYEEKTRSIRFDLYKKLMTGYCGGVILGHIKEDIEENFLRNVFMHVLPFNIKGMEILSKINNVNIIRPFININKSDIIKFASDCYIPYFEDTTPDWSIRGRFRRKLKPVMQEMFGNNICNGIVDFGDTLHDLGQWFYNNYVKSYNNIIIVEDNRIVFPYESGVPDIFWKMVIEDTLHKQNKSKPSHKVMKQIIDIIKNKKERKINIKKEMTGEFNGNTFIITLS